MPKAIDVPSDETRRLIAAAHNRSAHLRVQVVQFTEAVRVALMAFGAEVDPLRLSDDDYRTVFDASLLSDLLHTTRDMADRLAAVT